MKSNRMHRGLQMGWPGLWLRAGVACLVLSAIMGASTARYLSGSAVAVGTVIALEEKVNADDNRTYYYPVFSFEARDGKSYTAPSHTGGTSTAYSVGQVVHVRYSKSNPNSASIDALRQFWGGDVMPAVLGIVFLGISRTLKSAQKRKASPVVHPLS